MATYPAQKARRARVQSHFPALLVLVAGVLCIDLLAVGMVFSGLVRGDVIGDWLPFYAAGTIVNNGQAAQLYDATYQASVQRELFSAGITPMGYVLPAFVAVFFAPLSRLSYFESYLVWTGLNLVLLAGLCRLAWMSLAGTPPALRVSFVGTSAAIALLFPITLGQVDLLALAGVVGCYALLRTDRPGAAGAVLACALVKPHLVAGVLLLLLVKRQWATLASFALVAPPLLIAPALLAGPAVLADQAGLLFSFTSTTSQYGVHAESMINIRGPVTALTGSASVWLWAPLLALIASAAFTAALRSWRARPALDEQSWALALVLPLLYSPHLHFQTIVFLLAAGALYFVAMCAPRSRGHTPSMCSRRSCSSTHYGSQRSPACRLRASPLWRYTPCSFVAGRAPRRPNYICRNER